MKIQRKEKIQGNALSSDEYHIPYGAVLLYTDRNSVKSLHGHSIAFRSHTSSMVRMKHHCFKSASGLKVPC
jgi:predicted oxidoreductase (fatty acid repression mutant protein)